MAVIRVPLVSLSHNNIEFYTITQCEKLTEGCDTDPVT